MQIYNRNKHKIIDINIYMQKDDTQNKHTHIYYIIDINIIYIFILEIGKIYTQYAQKIIQYTQIGINYTQKQYIDKKKIYNTQYDIKTQAQTKNL